MAFVRSFVCIISVIATDKVRYSMVPGRTEREDGGREEMRREYGIEMNNKRQKERKSFARELNTHLHALVLYLHTSRVRFSQITDECFYRPMRYSNERRTRVRDVKPHIRHITKTNGFDVGARD